MSDGNKQASSVLSANLPSQPSPVFDLNAFSAMADDDDESDSELTNGLEEAITTKKHDLSAWSKLYHRTLLKMHKNPLDVNYQIPGSRPTDGTNHYRYDRNYAAAIRVESKKLVLDSGTPRFGDHKHGKGQTYQVIRDPHLFLDGFKTYCENSYGGAPFLASAQRLLCMAILDDQTRQQFNGELTRHTSSSLTWEECEVAFVDSVLTPSERFNTVARVAEIGRRHKESYRNFALRLQRSVRVYRIDDNNATVLSGIMSSIPSVERNLIKTSIQKSGTSLSDVKLDSICGILTNLSAMDGPYDSLKRPRSLIDDDSDDKSDVPLFRHNNKRQKRPIHQKNDRRPLNRLPLDRLPIKQPIRRTTVKIMVKQIPRHQGLQILH
ncbi:hypothetical protein BGX24_005494 [Mortierella sp. AD032]|nr:hypothetical protein BGX24_005494 [Mortierella sp. AD032]